MTLLYVYFNVSFTEDDSGKWNRFVVQSANFLSPQNHEAKIYLYNSWCLKMSSSSFSLMFSIVLLHWNNKMPLENTWAFLACSLFISFLAEISNDWVYSTWEDIIQWEQPVLFLSRTVWETDWYEAGKTSLVSRKATSFVLYFCCSFYKIECMSFFQMCFYTIRRQTALYPM